MRKLTIIQSVIVVSGFFVLTTFQNCSKIKASDLQSVSSAKASGTSSGPTVPGGNTSNGNPTKRPDVCKEGDWKSDDSDDDSSHHDGKSEHQGLAAMDKDDDKSDHGSEHSSGGAMMKCMPTSAEVVAACAGTADVTGQTDVAGLRGSHIVSVGAAMGSITDSRGSLIAQGAGQAQSHIVKMVDVRGNLIVCNLQADSIENTRGSIVLVNSKVKSLTNHKGSVFLYGGSAVDSSSGITGSVHEIP